MKNSLLPLAFACVTLTASVLWASELMPLSAADKAKLEKLLRDFDPATYEFRFQWIDSNGKLQNGRLGRAVGLGNVRQGTTTKAQPPDATHQPASTPSLRARGLGPNQTINGFSDDPILTHGTNTKNILKRNLDELDALLKKYTH